MSHEHRRQQDKPPDGWIEADIHHWRTQRDLQAEKDTATQIYQLWVQIAYLWICVFALLLALMVH